MNKISLIAKREFLTRVRKKTFLLSTILLPLVIFIFYAGIIYFSVKTSDDLRIAVVDEAGLLKDSLADKKGIDYVLIGRDNRDSLVKAIKAKSLDGVATLPQDPDGSISFVSGKAIGIMTRDKIEDQLSDRMEELKMARMNINKAQLDSARKSSEVSFSTLDGGKEDTKQAAGKYLIGYVTGFLIYIVLFIYGTMVMRGVMEEKVSRIAEVVVSSVKPFQLMMGKIIGIGSVGLLQFLIWIVLVAGLNILLPLLIPGMSSNINNMPAGTGQTAEQGNLIANIFASFRGMDFALILGCFVFYFLGGYLIYSSLFAAVGSAVNEDPQDAQSLMLPITMPIIFAIVIMTKAVNDPTSALAKFGSLFPLTSPIVMMGRIAHGVPQGVTWGELLLSMGLLIAGFIGTTWLAGRIYRTAILMYGKKPTWGNLMKWAFKG